MTKDAATILIGLSAILSLYALFITGLFFIQRRRAQQYKDEMDSLRLIFTLYIDGKRLIRQHLSDKIKEMKAKHALIKEDQPMTKTARAELEGKYLRLQAECNKLMQQMDTAGISTDGLDSSLFDR